MSISLATWYKCLKQRIKWWLYSSTTDNPIAHINLRYGDIAIDCGANVGTITQMMADTCATVYAFEPNPYAFGILQQRFETNPFVYCINKGVLDEAGVVKLFLHEHAQEDQVKWSTGSSLLEYKGNVNPNSSIEISVVDLSQFIQDLPERVKVLKVDVEGVEHRILNRLIDTGVVHDIDHIFVETHEEKIPELRPHIEALKRRIAQEELTHIRLDWI